MEKLDSELKTNEQSGKVIAFLPASQQRISGSIVSAKMQETAVILCERVKRHPKYKKSYRVSKKYKAHNPGNLYQEGDKVIIEATRPISKDKRWRIIREAISNK